MFPSPAASDDRSDSVFHFLLHQSDFLYKCCLPFSPLLDAASSPILHSLIKYLEPHWDVEAI